MRTIGFMKRAWVKYGFRSPMFIWAPCALCTAVLIGRDTAIPPNFHRIWVHIPVPELINPVLAKTSPKRSCSMAENERFGLVFAKTGSINSGTGALLVSQDRRHLFVTPWKRGTQTVGGGSRGNKHDKGEKREKTQLKGKHEGRAVEMDKGGKTEKRQRSERSRKAKCQW